MSNGSALIRPARHAVAVTEHDTNTIAPTLGLYVSVAGAMKVRMMTGSTVTFASAAAGYHPLMVDMVFDTDTDPNMGIVALY